MTPKRGRFRGRVVVVAVSASLVISSGMLQATPVLASSNYAGSVMSDSPQGYWRLGETGGTTAADASGHANVLTFGGGYVLGVGGAISGDPNTAVLFNGTTATANRTSSPVTTTTNWSVEAWVNPASISQAGVMAYDGNEDTTHGGFGFAISAATSLTTNGSELVGVVNGRAVDSGFAFTNANTWYHVVVTRDTSTMRFYVNGRITSKTSTTAPTAPSGRFSVGSGVNSTGSVVRPFNGVIDEAAIYATALSAGRIAAHFQEGSQTIGGVGQWASFTPTVSGGTLSARSDVAIAYDAAHSKVVMFGGKTSAGAAINETWTYDAGTNTWTKLAPAHSPSIRWGARMAFDAATNNVVLFGGTSASGSGYLSDTWTWNGTDWTRLSPATIPPTRADAGMVYDPGHNVVVMFGGNGGTKGTTYYATTYTWNGTNWTLAASTGVSARSGVAMAYDSKNSKVVLFGGYTGGAYQSGTFTWNGTAWSTTTPGTSPSVRTLAGAAFDPIVGKVVLFGGYNGTTYQVDTWTWDNANWGLQNSAAKPAARSAGGFLWNPVSSTPQLFGGINSTGAQSDNWNWTTPPDAATNVAGARGNQLVSVTWTAAGSGGATITQYVVTASPGGATATSTGNPAPAFATVTGLTNGTAYTFTVVATNSVGTGVPSAASAPVTPATVPGAPTSVTATGGNQQATVNWTPPSSNGGSAITGYTVTAAPGGATASAGAGATSATVTGLTNGTSYTFTVTATNSVGAGPASSPSNAVTPATVPGAPNNVAATPGNAQATVSWTAPASNGGAAITKYTVTSAPGGFTVNTPDGNTTTAIVTGLTNGTIYTFTVTATNSVGTGAASSASNAVTPATTPGAPTNVVATAGTGQATVTWNAPASDGGNAITQYTVTPFVGTTSGTPVSVNGSTLTASVTGLTNGTTYTFQVTATNSLGTGPPGTSNSVTPTGPPYTPANVTATGGNAQATVSWTAPGNGGSPITGYTITPYVGATAGTPVSVDGSTTSTTILNLQNGTTYTFQVTATNALGTSGAGTSNAVTPATVPQPPSVTATGGNAQATVTWTAPNNGGSAITGYTVTPYVGTTAGTPVSVGPTVLTTTFTALTNGTTYTFQVVATNAVGNSTPGTSNAVTPATVPGAPTNVTAASGNAQATVSWSAPASNGGAAISGYTVTPYVGGTAGTPVSVDGTTLTATVTGLTNGTVYTFQVYATNSAGNGPFAASAPITVGLPGAPTAVTATAAANQASVSWTAPASSGASAISGYIVTAYTSATAQNSIAVAGSATSTTITGLKGGTAYSFQVVAVNGQGAGPSSSPSSTVTPSGAGATYASTVLANSPAAYYRLGDPSGGIAADSSGNANHGAYNGATTLGATGVVSGDPDTAVTVDGNSGYVSAPTVTGLQADNTRTVEIWFKTSNGTQQVLFDSGGTGVTGQTFEIVLTQQNGLGPGAGPPQNTPGLVVAFGNADVYLPGLYLADGHPHYVAVTLTGATLNVYVDGAAAQGSVFNGTSWTALAAQPFTLPVIPSTPANPVWIGHGRQAFWTGSTYFQGTIDEVAIYPTALTSIQVSARAQAAGYLLAAATNVVATSGANQATVTWTAPSNASVATSVVVTAFAGATPANAIALDPSATTATLTGLQGGTAYTFTVVATNSFGASPPATSNAVTPTGSATTYTSTILSDTPSIYYRLGEPSGTVAADSSGNGRNGAYQSTPYTLGASGALVGDGDTATGFASNCCNFGQPFGGSELQYRGSTGLPMGNSPRTVEIWIKTSSSATMGLAGYGNTPSLQGFQVALFNGNVIGVISGSNDAPVYFTSASTIANGGWHLISVTYNGTTLTVYVDGISIGTGTFAGALNTQPSANGLILAHYFWCGVGCNQYNGTFDEFAVYGSALTATQVLAHFNASGNTRPTAPGSAGATAAANQVTVTWTASTASAGAPVTGYLVTANLNGTQAQNAIAVGGSTTSITISGLQGGASYTFVVTAQNNFGFGAASTPTAAVSPTGPASTYASTILGDSPSIYYRLGDPSGTLAADSSGNGHNGWYQNTPYTLGATGALVGDGDAGAIFQSNCCYFGTLYNGSELQDKLPNGLPAGNSARTVEVWVNTSFTTSMGLVGWGNSGSLGGFQVEMTNGNQIFVLSGNGDPVLTFTASYTIANGHWHVIDVTYDGTTVTVYLDGQVLGTGTFAGALNTQVDGNGLILAHRFYCGVGCDQYNGTLDEVSIYPAALTPTQISAHFAASGNSRPTAPTNVAASPGANQVTVTWTASTASSGSPVNGYVVTAFANGITARNAIAVGSGTTGTTITGLVAGTSYTFTVVAYNNFGSGPTSAASSSVSPTGAATTYASTVLGDGPVVYYRLGDPSGTVAADSSGNGRNGWYQSTPYTLAVNGALITDTDSAVTFASNCCNFGQPYGGSEMQYKTGAGLPFGNSARTVELWVKTTNTGTQALVGWGNASTHSVFEIRLVGGNQVQVVTWNDDKSFTAPSPIATGAWRHLVVTYDGTTLTAYLDMNLLGTSTFSGPLSTTNSANGLILAHDVWGGVGSSELNGSLDEVAIYTSVLTQLQVNAHYNASGNTQSIPSAPTGVTATGGVNQATVSWSPPSTDGGSPVTTYTVTPHSGTTQRTPTFVSGSVTSTVVTGLSGGTTYFFTVTASNANGSGPDSAPSNNVTPTGAVYPYAGTVLGDAPVGYWRLGEAAGTTAYDSSGNGNLGTYAGGVTLNQPAGVRNDPDPGITLDGTSGHVSVRSSATLDVTGALSVEAWVNFSSTTGTQQIVNKGDGATTNGTAYGVIYRSGSGISFETYASSGNNASALWRATPQTGAWYYVVGTRTADGALAIYVNGVLMGTANDGGGPLNDVNATVGIGASGVGTGANLEPLAGSVDDVAIYSSALSVAQVALHWTAAANRPGAPTNAAALATAANQITVTWTAPADGGSTAITGYVVTPHVGPNLATPSFAGATATSLAVGNLSAGTSYFFTVNAINSSGVGAASVPSAAVTATGTTTYPYSATVLGDGPVGYWRMGESTGNLATDSSGNGNTGTFVTGDQIGQPGAIRRDPGLSVGLDGANGQVLVPTASTINITADVTAETWVEFNSIATTQVLVGKGDGATNMGSAYQLAYTAGSGFTFTTFIGNVATTATYAISPTLGKWYHIVGTRTAAGNLTVWVNCNADNGGAFDGGGTLNTVGSALAVGSSGSGNGTHRFPVNGLIAEAAVYNTALAPSQVAGHWGAAGYVPAAPTNVTAVGEPNGAIVSWTPPSYPGTSPISGYIITAHVGSTTVGTPASVDPNTTSFNYGPISGGQTYTFTVTAVNASGACGPASASSPPVSITNPVAPNMGQSLAIVTSNIQPLPIGSFGYNTCWENDFCGVPGIDSLPSMSQWTIEGYISALSSNSVTGGNVSWGVLNVDAYGSLGRKVRVASAGRPVAGINFDIGARNGINSTLQTYFVWPGGQYAIPSDSAGLPIAADYGPDGNPQAPAYFALSYDGTTVRGYINGTQLFSQAANLAAIYGPGGFMDNQELATGIFDEFRISNTARYTGATMTPPTSNFATDPNTVLLWHMDGYALGQILAQEIAVPPVCDRPPVYRTNDVLIDSAGSEHGNAIGIGTCNFHISSEFYFSLSVGQAPAPGETRSASELKTTCEDTLFPVNCATGEFWHDFTDFSIPGRGMPLVFTRSYSSLAANKNGPLGYGWTDSYSMSLTIDGATGNVTVNEENGATVSFVNSGGALQAAQRVLSTLVHNADGTYTFKRKSQVTYTFDANGHLIDIADRNIYHTTLQYTNGQLTSVTDPAQRTLTFQYNANGLISQVTDPIGRFVQFTYDEAGVNGAPCQHYCLIDVRDVGGLHTTFTYDSNRRMLTMTDPRGGTVTNTYDSQGRVHTQQDQLQHVTTFVYGSGTTTVTDPNGNVTVQRYRNNLLLSQTKGYGTPQQATWSYMYDPITLGVVSVTDPNGHVATTRYDANGNIIGACDPMGRCASAVYNSFNEPTSSTDQLGVPNTVNYDTHGNMTSSSRPLLGSGQSATALFTYDPAHLGDALTMTDPNGKVWTYSYDQYGYKASQTDPAGNVTTFTHDAVGRLLTSVSPAGNVTGGNPAAFTTTYGYTVYGELNSVTDPLNHQTSVAYDEDGNVHSVTDANNHTTTYTYDAANQMTLVTRADTSTRTYVYDPDGNVTTVKDGLQQPTAFAYDSLNRTTSMTDPLSRTTQYGYDLAGRVTSITDAMGRITYINYDSDGEAVSITYSDGVTPGVRATYDAASRITTMTDGTGTSTYSYDSLHRLVQSTNGVGSAVGYGYDLNGNLTTLTYPGSGHVVNRTFDPDGRLSTVSDWLGHTTTYKYDVNSNLIEQDYPNGVVASFTYDNADRLTSLSDAVPPSQPFLSLNYGRDNVGQLTTESSKTFGYDTVNRLTSALIGGTQTNYTYDNADRMTQIQVQGGSTSTFAYDAADQLQSLTTTQGATQIQKYTYAYNSNGDRTLRTDQSNNSVSYGYDQADRLVSYGSATQYTYDGIGTRMSKTVSGVTTAYTWDLASSLPTLLQEGNTQYVAGLGGLPLEQINSSGQVFFYHADQLGSTRALTDVNGAVVQTYDYDSFGNQTSSTGSLNNPFQYAGQYTDAESSLQYLRARYYDPSSESFITRDPAVLLDPYAYSGDSPQSNSDPSGLDWLDAARNFYDHNSGWLSWVPYLGSGLEVLSAYDAFRHCDFDAAAEYLAPAVIGLVVGVFAGVLGGVGKSVAERIFGKAERSAAAAAEKDALRAETKAARGAGHYRGGLYKDLESPRRVGIQGHHLIADKVSPYSKGYGPAIEMDILDHRATSSWGKRADAVAYRARQKAFIDQGDTASAVMMDIEDIQARFGHKYDEAIMQALNAMLPLP